MCNLCDNVPYGYYFKKYTNLVPYVQRMCEYDPCFCHFSEKFLAILLEALSTLSFDIFRFQKSFSILGLYIFGWNISILDQVTIGPLLCNVPFMGVGVANIIHLTSGATKSDINF